jgi:cell division protein FtsI/penicillin-binding protein 2
VRRQRITVVFFALLAGLGLVELRLLRLQFLQNDLWVRESRRSTMQFDTLPFERGWILDRHGEPLAMTEEVRDVLFRFRDWRRGAALGQAAALMWLLDGERRSAHQALADAEQWLDALARVQVAQLAAMRPRQRGRDAATYMGWLLGRETANALKEQLASKHPPADLLVADLPGHDEGAEAARERLAAERAALQDLGRVSGLSMDALLDAMDEAVLIADERVSRILAREAEAGDPAADDFLRGRELHLEFDNDPVELARGVSYDCQTLVAVRASDLVGFSLRAERRRVYPEQWQDLATMLLGRVGLPREADLRESTADRLRLTDLASLEDLTPEELVEYELLRVRVREIDYGWTDERGTLGLEAALEPLLRGKRGWVAAVRDPMGEPEGEVESAPPQRGLNVTLTLDARMQRAAERVLQRTFEGELHGNVGGWPGAIVLLDPRTGEVLALATGPGPTREQLMYEYGALLSDASGPTKNRALADGVTGNLPPPGSTFKPIAAAAALASGLLSPSDRLLCDGTIKVGPETLGCLGRHGEISMTEAIARSCNLYFYRLADVVGGEVLRDAALRFGLSRATNLLRGNAVLASLGIPVESGVREPEKPLQPGSLGRTRSMRLAIGQAPLDDVTPLQVASAFGSLGVGERRPPSLIAAVEGYGRLPPGAAQSLGCSEAQLAAVRAGMEAVVDHPAGTAHALRALLRGAHDTEGRPLPPGLAAEVAGKTGTPEVQGRPDHSWFAGYMPREQPRLAFAILLEHTGEHGGDACVPVLAELLRDPSLHAWLLDEVAP